MNWPGLKSENSRIMREPGEMSDCTNVMIDVPDVLEKRNGFVRALDEAFNGVVCGLFPYTDDCGQEYLLVADEEMINIRTPFVLPTFTVADCYPLDDFSGIAGELDQEVWRNTGDYKQANSEMIFDVGAPNNTPSDVAAQLGDLPRWFKNACGRSYQTFVEYTLPAFIGDPALEQIQRVILVLRGTGDLTTGPVLFAYIERQPSLSRVSIRHRRANGNVFNLVTQDVQIGTQGFFTFRFDATSLVPSAVVQPIGVAPQTVAAPAIDTLEELSLGFVSAIGMGRIGIADNADQAILNVSGGSFSG